MTSHSRQPFFSGTQTQLTQWLGDGAENHFIVALDLSGAGKDQPAPESIGKLIDAIEAVLLTMPMQDALGIRASRYQLRELKAKYQLMAMGHWLTALEVLEILGDGIHKNALYEWIEQREIFAVNWLGEDYFPRYGLDTDLRMPRPIIKEILEIFDNRSPWCVAGWFASVNSYLGGSSPIDFIEHNSAKVILAAKDSRAGILHG